MRTQRAIPHEKAGQCVIGASLVFGFAVALVRVGFLIFANYQLPITNYCFQIT